MLKSFLLGFLGLVKHGGWVLPLKHFFAKTAGILDFLL